jgi:hypothetical protein
MEEQQIRNWTTHKRLTIGLSRSTQELLNGTVAREIVRLSEVSSPSCSADRERAKPFLPTYLLAGRSHFKLLCSRSFALSSLCSRARQISLTISVDLTGQEAAERLLQHHETRVQALETALEREPSNEEARAKLEKHLRDRHLAAAVLLDSHESKLAEARERLAQNLSDLTARRAFEEATQSYEEAVEAQRSTGKEAGTFSRSYEVHSFQE